MTAVTLALALVLGQAGGSRAPMVPWIFNAPASKNDDFQIQIRTDPLEPPRRSPKGGWEFPWVVLGYAKVPANPEVYTLRFRVLAQQRAPQADPAPLVGRMLLQLWGYNVRNLRLEHSERYHLQLVDVFLAQQGKPGGEHLFGNDPYTRDPNGRPVRLNQIYIYDIATFTNFREMAREVAHEYGHATLPAIGGYTSPETWANGYLGEKLYLRWLHRDLAAGHLERVDAMGASAADLAGYVRDEVAPLERTAALLGPRATALARADQVGMENFLGLALYSESMLPARVFQRSLLLCGTRGADYPRAVVEAASEVPALTLRVPATVRGERVWIPLGRGRLNGLNPLARRDGWALVKPTADIIRVKNPPL